jgi:hypothetical protein
VSETTRSSGTSRSKGQTFRICCIYLATTAGLVCAIASWGLGGTVISVVVVATATAVVASSVWGADGRSEVPRIVRVTFASGLITPAAVGLIAVFKVAGVLLVVALAATTPALTAKFPRGHRKEDPPAAQPEPVTPAVATASSAGGSPDDAARELDSLDDGALCLAWRRSFRLLETAPSTAIRLAVVQPRQKYLDELQRRSPEGLAAWLASGARASGNPLPYVEDARRRAS